MEQICSQCGKSLPLTTEFYAKYSSKDNKFEPGYYWHTKCKQCEYENKVAEHWKDGLLKCTVCGEYFPEEVFNKIGSEEKKYHYRNGRDNRCPTCKLLQNRKHRANLSNDEKLNKAIKFRWSGAKSRAEKKGIMFDITEEFIKSLWEKQKGLCALSKIPMTYTFDNGRTFTNISIDQINPNAGYVEDNIQLVCMAINQMKSDMSLEELYMFSEALIKNKNNEYK